MAGFAISGRLTKGLQARLRRMPSGIRQTSVQAMHAAVALVERDLRQRALTGEKGNDPFWGVTGAKGDALGVRTGHTRRSIASAVLTSGNAVLGTVGSAMPYMHIQEEGGTISGHPYLRIPTRAGQRAGSGTVGLGNAANEWIWKSPAGKLWIAEKGTARAKLAAELNGYPLLLALLATKVTLRARHMFLGTLNRTRAAVRQLLGDSYRGVVRGSK